MYAVFAMPKKLVFWKNIGSQQIILIFIFYNTVYRFPNFSTPKSDWSSTLDVSCGYGKQWDPPTVLGCIDPRGCQPPPPGNNILYSSYDQSATKTLDVGTAYWYSCRTGLFSMGPANLSSFIEVKWWDF